jgi:flavin reductase (DIM6/NTAB) family NADH-FMN oxidoreductase RutF
VCQGPNRIQLRSKISRLSELQQLGEFAKIEFAEPRISLFPTPVVIVTSINNDNVVGATTIAWAGVVSSRPPVLSVSFRPDSFTRTCINDSREFVVNVPTGDLVEETNLLGAISGPIEFKIEELSRRYGKTLHLEDSVKIRSPRIAECYLAFECRSLFTMQVGLYDLYLGEVLRMHCDAGVYQQSHPRGAIDYKRVQPLMCLGDEYWAGNECLGRTTENKNHPHDRLT